MREGEMKHTPGPWRINDPEWPNDIIIENNFGTDVAEVLCKPGCWYCPALRETSEANARLIAAAPQMYEALAAIKALLGPDGDYAICRADGNKCWLGDDMIVGGAFEKADAALAAAGGES